MTIIQLFQKILQFKSITPNDDGAFDFIEEYLGDTWECITLDINETKNRVFYKKFNETKVDLGTVSGDQSTNVDLDDGSIYTMTLNGDLTLNSLANATAGASGMIIITQDGTGSRTITTGSNIKWAGGNNALSTGFGSIDVINFMYDGTTYYFSLTKGYEAQ